MKGNIASKLIDGTITESQKQSLMSNEFIEIVENSVNNEENKGEPLSPSKSSVDIEGKLFSFLFSFRSV